jgi:hypothetical protein
VSTTVTILVVIVVLLVLALAAAGFMLQKRRRSERLQEHFGPEYERLARSSDTRRAEAELSEREKRHRELEIRPLEPDERERYTESWSRIQRGFVDDPEGSLHDADRLVVDIMHTRGYPVDDFDQRADDVSVEHPDVVRHYREAREIRDASRDGRVSTEDQRSAVTSYRALIEALVGPPGGAARPAGTDAAADTRTTTRTDQEPRP